MIAANSASSSGSRTRFVVAILAGLVSMGVVAVTKASPGVTKVAPGKDNVPQVEVNYDDLDISTQKGALILYRRIASAARDVCPQPVAYSSRVAEISRKCVAEAIKRAVRDIDSPELAKVEAERNRRPS